MQFKRLLNDDDAVSPVIGVILMVAITVILAAVIGTFVLGLGDQVQETSPNAQISFDFTDNGGTNDELEVAHTGGDSLDNTSIGISNGGDTVMNDGTKDYWFTSGDKITAGDSMTLDGGSSGGTLDLNTGTWDSDSDVSVIWESDGGEQSSTLRTWNAN